MQKGEQGVPGGVEEVSVAHNELPDVDEVGHGVAFLHQHLLGVAHPDRVLGVARRQPPHQRRRERVKRLPHQHPPPVRLARPQQRHKHLRRAQGITAHSS